MKKCWILVILMGMLTGCGRDMEMETVFDEIPQMSEAPMQQAVWMLPADATMAVLESEDAGRLYLCDGYTVTFQTCLAGDLEGTLRQVTGYGKEKLNMIRTQENGIEKIQCVWTAAGEGEDQVCRMMLLDDGAYHYVLTCMADASRIKDLEETWQSIFDSFTLAPADSDPYTGS